MKIGVLGLQGDFYEHVKVVESLVGKDNTVVVKNSEALNGISGLIIPGGESTTIGKLMTQYGIDKEIMNTKLPIFGTCAGAILLAKSILGSSQFSLNLLDISIQRNDYGRQKESFEADLDVYIDGLKRVRGVFIRAPVIKSTGEGVEVLSKLGHVPILVKQGNVLASTFHPELAGEKEIHRFFIEEMAAKY